MGAYPFVPAMSCMLGERAPVDKASPARVIGVDVFLLSSLMLRACGGPGGGGGGRTSRSDPQK